MENKNIITASAAALVAVIAVSGFAFSSFAAESSDTSDSIFEHRGQMRVNLTDEEKAEFEAERDARRADMNEAIESGYDAWSALVAEHNADAQVLEVINEDNFADFVAAHNKMEAGREMMDGAREDMEALGVERGMGHGQGMRKGMRGGNGRGMGMH